MNTTFIKPGSRHFSLIKKAFCAGALVLGTYLNAAATFVKIGSGTTSNAATVYPTPFGSSLAGQKAQYYYKASELLAAGMKPGWIDAMGFLVIDTNQARPHTSLKFYVGSATLPNLSTQFEKVAPAVGGLPLRFFNKSVSYLAFEGWNDFSYTVPYYWNGTDNIVVGTCFWNSRDVVNGNASVEWTTSAFAGASRTYTMSSSASGGGISICEAIESSGTADPNRPNIRFNINSDTCKVAPNAGIANSSDDEFCLKDDSLELSLTGNSLAFGLSFQWQRSVSATGPWSNIGTASTTSTTAKAVQTEGTYYRCIVTCVAAGLSSTTATIYVPMAAPYRCDCASGAASATQEKILSVRLADMLNLTPCSVLSTGYTDFAGGSAPLPPVAVEPGTEYELTTRLGSCDVTNNSRAVKVFIDYNQNTVYEASEMVYANTYSSSQPNPQNAIGTFTIPTTAKTGITTMRIVYAQASALSDIVPCGTYAFGETQDYAINILTFGKPTVTGRLKVCQYDSVVMNAASVADTPVVFSWTGPGGFTGVGPKITFVNADPSLSGTYYVTATSGGRTSTPQAVEVVVYPKPAIPNVLNANMCQYEADGTLKTDGKNVLWYNVPVGGFGDTAAPKLPTYTPNTATFYVTQTVNGCVSDRGKVVVNILLKPAPPTVKSPVTYCQLQIPELAAKGTDLKWYLDSAGGVASTISPIPPTGFPDEIDYYVSQTINGCESDRARIRVIVYEQPNGIILHTKPYVCQYDTASFIYFGNAPLSYDYKWFSTDAILESGGGQGPVVFRFNTPGDKVINLFVNNGKCATSKIVDTITVRAAPIPDIAKVKYGCIGDQITVTMDSVTQNSTDYQWDWDGGTLVNETIDGGPYNLIYNTPGDKEIRLVVYNRTCPSLPVTEKFFIYDRPYAKIQSIEKVTDFGKDTAALTGKICSRDTLIFSAYYNALYKYNWFPEYYFDRDTTHIVSDRMRAPGFVTVVVENEFGCRSADSTYVNAEACCELAFPNAFTPNGDSKNDVFRPIRDGRQDIVTFRVVNRWGQVVFETASTDTQGWDGTFAGKMQDMGVYQYYIKYKCLDNNYYEKKGDVTLIR